MLEKFGIPKNSPGSKVHKQVAGIVKKAGYPVHMGTPYCLQNIKKFGGREACKSCESEHGCFKTMKILNAFTLLFYTYPGLADDLICDPRFMCIAQEIIERKEA